MRIYYTFRQLEYFVTVGETGSVTKAAEKFNISPPSVSAAVMQFEEEMGAPLFMRKQANGMSLTPAGKKLLREAKKLLTQAEGLTRLIGAAAGKIAGPFNLGCLQTIAPYILPSLRRAFERRHPQVRVWQKEDNQAALLAQLQNNELDACLTYDLRLPASFVFYPLIELPAYVILPPTHPLAKRRFITPDLLRREKLILVDLPLSGKYFMSIFQAAGIRPAIAERCKDMALMRAMVANGFGYGLGNLPPSLKLSSDGKPLAHIPLKGGLRPMRLGLVTAKNPFRRGIINAFVSHCQQTLDGNDFNVGSAGQSAKQRKQHEQKIRNAI